MKDKGLAVADSVQVGVTAIAMAVAGVDNLVTVNAAGLLEILNRPKVKAKFQDADRPITSQSLHETTLRVMKAQRRAFKLLEDL